MTQSTDSLSHEQKSIAAQCHDITRDTKNMLHELYTLQNDWTMVDHFLKGVLERVALFMRDIGNILADGEADYRTSAMVLIRVVLEDYIRAMYVLTSPNQQDALDRINGQAMKYDFDLQKIFAQWATEYPRPNALVPSQKQIQDDLQEFLANPDNAGMLQDGKFRTFKLDGRDKQLLDAIGGNDLGRYPLLLYKHFSQYVHYSFVTYANAQDDTQQLPETEVLKQVLHYARSVNGVIHKMLKREYHINPPPPTPSHPRQPFEQ